MQNSKNTSAVSESNSQDQLEQRLAQMERIAARALLRRWMSKYAPLCRPGGWDYDHDAAELCKETAELLGDDSPW